jgi:hypothetical protein
MKRIVKNIFATLLFLPLFFHAGGQDVKVTSAFDSTRIFIGDQVRFTITIDQPEGLKLALPAFKDTLMKNIDVLSGPVIDSSKQKGRIRIIEKYIVTSFDSGRYQLPPVYAEMKNESGLKRFYSDYTVLDVRRIKLTPPDTAAQIFDIIKPYRAPITAGEIIPWVLAAAIVAALVWFGMKYYKKLRESRGEVEVIVNPDPAHIIAFRELEKLRDEKLWQSGEIKLYYTRLTEILRQYLENRYGIYSLELTTSETLDALHKSGFRKDANYNLLKGILTNADLVKFAKYNPEPAEHESVFQDSWNFVMATKQELIMEEAVPEQKGGTAS